MARSNIQNMARQYAKLDPNPNSDENRPDPQFWQNGLELVKELFGEKID
jgi:hypothetical protein